MVMYSLNYATSRPWLIANLFAQIRCDVHGSIKRFWLCATKTYHITFLGAILLDWELMLVR